MRRFKLNQSGDTIVEIMVTTSILALVLAVSFVAANRSLSVGTAAANRGEALQYAQSQVELLRTAIDNDERAGTIFAIPASEFCMTSATAHVAGECSQSPFKYGIRYNYDFDSNKTTSSQTFSIIAHWPSNTSSTNDQVVLYFQDPQ